MTVTLSAEREQRLVWVLAGIQFMQLLDFVLMMPLGTQLMRLFALTPRDFACRNRCGNSSGNSRWAFGRLSTPALFL